jgi:hypothetical protein
LACVWCNKYFAENERKCVAALWNCRKDNATIFAQHSWIQNGQNEEETKINLKLANGIMKLRKIRIETLQQYETSKKKQGFRITNNKKIIENKDNNNNHNSVVYYD